MDRMKTSDLTPEQLLAVACPTCGAEAGKHCKLRSGGLRSSPHPARELRAAVAVDKWLDRRFGIGA